jgi:hypothetical protein
MIKTEFGYRQTLELIESMERSLEDIKRRLLPDNPRLYKLESEGVLDSLKQLKAEANEYTRRKRKAS